MANFFDVEGLDNHVCLVGPPQSGKSSLLFQHAVSCAESGHHIIFITPQPLDHLPLLTKSTQLPLPHKVLSRIHFKYPTTLPALQKLFDHAHLPNGLVSYNPDCVFIDNLHHYFTPLKGSGHDVTLALIKTCAHIIDGLAYVNSCPSASATDQPPQTLSGARKPVHPVCFLSLTPQQPLLNTNVIRRWFPHLLKLNETHHKTFCLVKGGQLLFSFKFQKNYFETSNENSIMGGSIQK